ncbi:MAG: F0F1 ATP synthase subunit B [bacterium]|nr:F0F1 ATP synthase subunit B [bacterium]
MDSLIEIFHIDIKLLIAQAVNFTIVFLVLYFLVFKPLSKIMADRSEKISKSLDDAKKIEEKLVLIEDEHKQSLIDARKEVELILTKANNQAEESRQVMLAKTREEIGQIINVEKAKMQTEKAQTLKEIKNEIADLIMITVEKVLEKKINSKEDKELIKKIIRDSKK